MLLAILSAAPRAALAQSAQSCEPCHADVVTQWRQSAHADAFTNALFAASYRRERSAWCVGCHAPSSPASGAPLGDEGVSCAACHVRDGALIAARSATAAAQRAHPIVVDAQRLSAEVCAGCHQFNWPLTTEPLVLGPHPMQNTVAEWRAGGAVAACADCHMASGHRMPGGHDAPWVRGALDVVVELRAPRSVRVRLRSHDVGHALPTGDPFRRLVVQLCASPLCEEPLREVVFGRRFDGRHAGQLLADTTVPLHGERQFDVPQPEGARFWRLVYRYAAVGTYRDLDDDDREQVISNGRIGGS